MGDWNAAATPLPPTANAELCACMMKSLSSVVNPDVSPDKYRGAYNYVGGKDASAMPTATTTKHTQTLTLKCAVKAQTQRNMTTRYVKRRVKPSPKTQTLWVGLKRFLWP